jgi:hypothetical protein
MNVYLLYREINDQTGKSQVIGVFTERDYAEAAETRITRYRTYITEVPLNPIIKTDLPLSIKELLGGKR